MNEKELNYKELWDGVYRGVEYEIVHWRLGWNYYLIIPSSQIPDDMKHWFMVNCKTVERNTGSKPQYFFDFYGKPLISELDWHIGLTYFEKMRDAKGVVIGYKLGCDYMHYWDEEHEYNLEYVKRETLNSIDKLWEHIPNLLLRSAWNGEYYPADKVYYTDKGVCVALEHKEQWEKII
jgi:hypothetical protein